MPLTQLMDELNRLPTHVMFASMIFQPAGGSDANACPISWSQLQSPETVGDYNMPQILCMLLGESVVVSRLQSYFQYSKHASIKALLTHQYVSF